MVNVNEDRVNAKKNESKLIEKNVSGKSTSDAVFNLESDIYEEKKFQIKNIGLNDMPKLFIDGCLETQKREDDTVESIRLPHGRGPKPSLNADIGSVQPCIILY